MELRRKPIVVVQESQAKHFENRCKKLYEMDYEMVTINTSYNNEDEFLFVPKYIAVFKDKTISTTDEKCV